jgi:hypothetical protein
VLVEELIYFLMAAVASAVLLILASHILPIEKLKVFIEKAWGDIEEMVEFIKSL